MRISHYPDTDLTTPGLLPGAVRYKSPALTGKEPGGDSCCHASADR